MTYTYVFRSYWDILSEKDRWTYGEIILLTRVFRCTNWESLLLNVLSINSHFSKLSKRTDGHMGRLFHWFDVVFVGVIIKITGNWHHIHIYIMFIISVRGGKWTDRTDHFRDVFSVLIINRCYSMSYMFLHHIEIFLMKRTYGNKDILFRVWKFSVNRTNGQTGQIIFCRLFCLLIKNDCY